MMTDEDKEFFHEMESRINNGTWNVWRRNVIALILLTIVIGVVGWETLYIVKSIAGECIVQ